MTNKVKSYTTRIILLTIILFSLRVLAQFVEAFVDISFIPDFEEWHSASVPYWRLLVAQLLILLFMILSYRRFNSRNVRYVKWRGYLYLIWGAVYFLAMLGRHILGLTIYTESVWFTSFLSIYFHYVLSLFLITIGLAHYKNASVN
ncbi:MAG: hypothetical protein ACI865_001245 [Flavobacteriaceae bacterium]|jgi:hypothetical protein